MNETRSKGNSRLLKAGISVFAATIISLGMSTVASAEQAAPETKQVSVKKDYCGGKGPSKWVPDHWGKANFAGSCKRHDACYSPKSHTDRLTCDRAFRNDMRRVCHDTYASGVKQRLCLGMANTYYKAVRKYAKSHYKGSGDPS
ncbi:phospholipase A2 [Sciscionella marina]|uniref:phospholipase A2 n=1 Tax=Sciscionella marina TaxID=508770 RepID=UPI0003764819|nr:phospholipase A2 [Sciscionella marina]